MLGSDILFVREGGRWGKAGMKFKTRYDEIRAYRTKDGSEIRELMHPDHAGIGSMSLAEAVVEIGQETENHHHRRSEEIYFIVDGSGIMVWGDESFPVERGDTILIPPGTPHKIRNTGHRRLRVLCCCAPPYSHTDTELLA